MKLNLRCFVFLLACLGMPAFGVAQPLAPENHRISVQVLDPVAAPVAQWQVKVYVYYGPLEQNAPNTTETTRSMANCQKSRYDLFPSFKRCTVTLNRRVTVTLPDSQIDAVDARRLDLDFAPVIEDHGGTFKVDEILLEYSACAKGCSGKMQNIRLTCFAGEADPGEVLVDDLLLSYSRGSKAAPQVADCGLHKGIEPGWANWHEVQARVRGHFGWEQRQVSDELLNSFAAIPTPDHHWVWNPAQKSSAPCESVLSDHQSYLSSQSVATLPATLGWPYHHEVEVYVTRKPGGEVCSIWLTGTDDEAYLRYFYDFAGGNLVRVYTSGEPKNVTHLWRWVNGEPWEFTRRQPDGGAEHDDVLYWQKTAAQLWPADMDYTPDLKEFALLKDFAGQLFGRFAVQNAP